MKYPKLNHEDGVSILVANGYYPIVTKRTQEDFLRACKDGKIDVVRGYLAIGMPTDIHDSSGEETPLIRATEGKHIDIIDILLDYDADLESLDRWGDTALLTAVNWGHPNVLAHLISKGAKLDLVSNSNNTPIVSSIKDNHEDMLIMLLEAGAKPDFGAFPPICRTIWRDDIKWLKYLLDAGASPSAIYESDGDSLLMAAIGEGKLNFAELLLTAGADPHHRNNFGWTAWMIAMKNQHYAFADKLVEKYGVEEADFSVANVLDAAENGLLEDIEAYLENGGKVDAHIETGVTLLMRAADGKQLDIINLLLQHGANPNLIDSGGNSALSNASYEGFIEGVEALLEVGASPNDEEGKSWALYFAVDKQHVEIVRLLLERGANPDTQFSYGRLPVHAAASHSSIEMLSMLQEAGADLSRLDESKESALYQAVKNGRFEVAKWLIAQGVELNQGEKLFNHTPLYTACDKYKNTDERYADIVRVLLEAGADYTILDWHHGSPLEESRSERNKVCEEVMVHFLTHKQLEKIQAGGALEGTDSKAIFEKFAKTQNYDTLLEWLRMERYDIAEGLLRAGISPNPEGLRKKHPLEIVAKQENMEMLELLFVHGANPNCETTYGGFPFLEAVNTGNLEIVKRFVKAGGDIHRINHWYTDVFKAAAKKGFLEIMKYLHSLGAPVERYPVGWTALSGAAGNGHFEAVEWLLEKGANPNAMTSYRRNSLTQSIQKKRYGVMRLLLNAGGDVNFIGEKGQSLLVMAVIKGDLNMVKLLLSYEADPYIQDEEGKNAFTHSTYRAEILKELEKYKKEDETTGRPALRPITGELTPLLEAIYQNDYQRFLSLIEAGADLTATNYRGDSALMIAIARCNKDMINKLLELGVDTEHKNTVGDNAWVISTHLEDKEFADELKEKLSPELDMKAVEQQFDLMMRIGKLKTAVTSGNIADAEKIFSKKELDLLLLPGAKVPLTVSLVQSDESMFKMLLEKGANPNIPNKHNVLSLHYAVLLNKLELTRLLLKHGADVRMVDYSGRDAVVIAENENNEAIKELIRKHIR